MKIAKESGADLPDASGEKNEKPSREKWISENLGVTGIMPLAIAVALAFSRLHWVLFFYTALYGAGSVWMLFKLARKNR